MDALWTLPELVAQVAARIAALPAPRNGQVRAIPDERTVRYYATIGLLDRPAAMRGRTALYGPRHVAQVVAIKRLQAMGRSLSEIQTLWPTLDAHTLARMSGVALEPRSSAPARPAFWKRGAAPPELAADDAERGHAPAEPARSEATLAPDPPAGGAPVSASAPPAEAPVELRIELAPKVVLSLSIGEGSVALSPADVRAVRAAAAPLLAALASRRIGPHPSGEEP
ncbi:MAG TPA: MerR family transcriptional regulator [Kofleriaceae bacterium]|nr:MerR family transcriptional regulator [Kofleriaceae bacterium]